MKVVDKQSGGESIQEVTVCHDEGIRPDTTYEGVAKIKPAIEGGVVSAGMRRGLRDRLMSDGLYADEERVREVLAAVDLDIESLEPFTSDVHLHTLTVAVKR